MAGKTYEMNIMFPDATAGDTAMYGDAEWGEPMFSGYLYEMRINIEVL